MIWIGAVGDDGYPRFHDPAYGDDDAGPDERSDIIRASRWLWWAHHGTIPSKTVVMHECNLPLCVALTDITPGTQADNLAMAARLRRTGGHYHHYPLSRRALYAQSLALRAAIRAAVTAGISDPNELGRIVTAITTATSPTRGQQELFPAGGGPLPR